MIPHTNDKPLSVLLLAGRRPGLDPIAEFFGTDFKVTAPVAGKPMIMHTLSSLESMTNISHIYVLSQEPDDLSKTLADYSPGEKVTFLKSESGIANSILTAWKSIGLSVPFIITTADNCMIRQEHVDDFLSKAKKNKADLSLGLVEKTQLVNRYPESRRTWLKFKDISATGCNLFLAQSEAAENIISYWKSFESRPKKVFKLAWSIGPFIFIKYLLKQMSLKASFEYISKKTKTEVQAVVVNDPDIAIDADKISDIVQIESIFNLREKKPGNHSPVDSTERPLVIFDLDRTITTHGTFLPFLLYYAIRNNPLRLLLLPAVVFMMLLYLCRMITRKHLKTLMQSLLIGKPDKSHLDDVCDRYVSQVLEKSVNLDALFYIRRWQTSGAKLVIATASFDWMARSFAKRLGFDEIIASKSREVDGVVVPGIDGENCYGQDKLAIVEKELGNLRELKESGKEVWFYTDHHSDIPLLEVCSYPVVINPSDKLESWARRNQHVNTLYWDSQSISYQDYIDL